MGNHSLSVYCLERRMTFSSGQIERARELARKQRKHGAIMRLLQVELNLRPAKCRVLLRTALAYKKTT